MPVSRVVCCRRCSSMKSEVIILFQLLLHLAFKRLEFLLLSLSLHSSLGAVSYALVSIASNLVPRMQPGGFQWESSLMQRQDGEGRDPVVYGRPPCRRHHLTRLGVSLPRRWTRKTLTPSQAQHYEANKRISCILIIYCTYTTYYVSGK